MVGIQFSVLGSQFVVHRQPSTTWTRRSSGYTLIELVMVIGLLGLAASLLIPYMVERSTLESQAAVRHIVADLSFAQSDALAHQEMRRVHFYDDGRGYCIVRITEANFGAEFDPDTALYVRDPLAPAGYAGHYIIDFTESDRFANISITDVNIDNNQRHITYDALGGTVMSGDLPGTGGYIEVTSEDVVYRINITPFTGKLTVENVDD